MSIQPNSGGSSAATVLVSADCNEINEPSRHSTGAASGKATRGDRKPRVDCICVPQIATFSLKTGLKAFVAKSGPEIGMAGTLGGGDSKCKANRPVPPVYSRALHN